MNDENPKIIGFILGWAFGIMFWGIIFLIVRFYDKIQIL